MAHKAPSENFRKEEKKDLKLFVSAKLRFPFVSLSCVSSGWLQCYSVRFQTDNFHKESFDKRKGGKGKDAGDRIPCCASICSFRT